MGCIERPTSQGAARQVAARPKRAAQGQNDCYREPAISRGVFYGRAGRGLRSRARTLCDLLRSNQVVRVSANALRECLRCCLR